MLNIRIRKMIDEIRSVHYFPFFLLFLTFLSYGILLPTLGYCGDDFSYAWLAYKVGSVETFFSHNRPIVGFFFSLLTRFLSYSPLLWHLFFLMLRWVISFSIFYLFRSIKILDKRAAYYISVLFLLYPGAIIFYQPLTFSVGFISLFFLFSSLWLSMLTIQNKKWSLIFQVTALVFEFLNLIILEYFYFLELLRPILIWLVLPDQNKKERFKKTAIDYLPYFIVFLGVSLFRIINQTNIVAFDSPILINEFMTNPLGTLQKFIPLALNDIFKFSVGGWSNAFRPQQYFTQQGGTTTAAYFALVIVSGIFIFLYFLFINKREKNKDAHDRKSTLTFIGIGIFAMFLAGFAPWIAGLETSIELALGNRFAQAFALGSSMVLAGLLLLFSNKSKLPIIILSIICALSIGIQFFSANVFRYSWINQKRFNWQLAWRFPSLPIPTIFVSDPLLEKKTGLGENPISASINWMYFHDIGINEQNQIGFYLYFDESRMVFLNNFEIPLPAMYGHLIGKCTYDTYKLIALANNDRCLRVLDPTTARFDPVIPNYLKKAASLSDLETMNLDNELHTFVMDPILFGPEPDHDWCYFFEKADLARTSKDWSQVLQILTEASGKGFSPITPSEKMTLLEAFMGLEKWEQALELSREIHLLNKEYDRMICGVLEKFAVPSDKNNQENLKLIRSEILCD